MKILRINTSASEGGAALSALNIQGAVTELSLDSWFLSARDCQYIERRQLSLGESPLRLHLNAFAYRLFGIEGFANRTLWGKFLPRLNDFDLIHLHNVHGYYMPFDVLDAILSRPCVWTLHDYWLVTGGPGFPLSTFESRKRFERFLPFVNLRYPVEWFDRSSERRKRLFSLIQKHQPSLVAVSHSMADRLKSLGLPSDNLTVIPHGLYGDDLAPSVLDRMMIRKKKGWPLDKHIFLFTSAQVDNPIKGCSVFLDALNTLTTDKPWVAYIVGDKSEVSRHKAQNLALNVQFFGKVNESEMRECFRACDTYVTPTFDETFGRTVVEALAEGARVICSDLPVLREVSRDSAVYFPLGDVRVLAKEMTKVLRAPLDEIYFNVANEIRNCFSTKLMAQEYAQLYKNEINNKVIIVKNISEKFKR